MKRISCLLLAFLLLSTGCMDFTQITERDKYKHDNDWDYGKLHYPVDSEPNGADEPPPIYTDLNFPVQLADYNGSLSWAIGDFYIETEEQLDFILENIREGDSQLYEFIDELNQEYPVGKNVYLLGFQQKSYRYNTIDVNLAMSEDLLYFAPITKMTTYYDTEEHPEMELNANCFIAVVPAEMIPPECHSNWIAPDPNNIKLYPNYRFSVVFNADSQLLDVYGDTRYIIRNEEEYERFLAMSEHLDRTGSCVPEPVGIDFHETAYLVYFLERKSKMLTPDGVSIDGNQIHMEIIQGENDLQSVRKSVSMAFALIPVQFLTEEQYDGWKAP